MHFNIFQEMTYIVKAIYDMMGRFTYPALKTDTTKQHVDAFFQVSFWLHILNICLHNKMMMLSVFITLYITSLQKMDKNRDGVVTFDEFILSCQEVKYFCLFRMAYYAYYVPVFTVYSVQSAHLVCMENQRT